jgi:lysophospholipase L1-like esterase
MVQPASKRLVTEARLAAVTPGDVGAATAAQGAKADSAIQPAQVRGNKFVALGDSISTAADLAAGGAGYGGAWPHMLCALTMQRLNFGGNAGVSGNNTTQILARVPDAIALAPAIVTVLGGTNDLTQSVTFATWSANIKSIAAQLRAAGIRVVLCTIPPRGNTTYLTTQTTWNTWLRQFAADNRYDLLDFYTLLADPATGMYKSGYDSGDALHPSQTAHIVMAQYASQQLTTSAFAPIAARSAIDTANLIANPLMTSGSPTPTSWIPSGSASADYTEGLVTDADFDGKAWEVAYTNAASSSNFRQFKSFAINTGSGFAVGDRLLFTARVKVTAATGITPSTTPGLRFRLDTNGGTPTAYTPVQALGVVCPVSLLWFTTTVPSGTTSIQLDAIVGVLPVGANFTVRLGNFGVYNLSALASTAP